MSRFPCQGRCITGPRIDIGYNVCAWSAIGAPCAFYYIFCARYLWEHVTPLLPLLTTVILAFTITFLLLTACTDPGFIPRPALQLAVPDLPMEVAQVTGSPPIVMDPNTRQPVVTLSAELETQGYKWCMTCQLVRPPRAAHCRYCNSCVLKFDHHCPFVMNCIGQRNYIFFVGFLAAVSSLGMLVFVGIGLWFSQSSAPTSLGWVLIFMGAPVAVVFLGVLSLGAFHIWIACRGYTTKEAFSRRSVEVRSLPRSRSGIRGPTLLRTRSQLIPTPECPLTLA